VLYYDALKHKYQVYVRVHYRAYKKLPFVKYPKGGRFESTPSHLIYL